MILTLEQQERVKLTPAVNQHGNYCDGPVDFHLFLTFPPTPPPSFLIQFDTVDIYSLTVMLVFPVTMSEKRQLPVLQQPY